QARVASVERRSSRESDKTGEKLGKSEGLRQIVIAARIKTRHSVRYTLARCQNKNRGFDSCFAHGPNNRKTFQSREHAINHNHVVAARRGGDQTVSTIGEVVTDVPQFAQSLQNVGGGLGVVLDQKNAHLEPQNSELHRLHRLHWRTRLKFNFSYTARKRSPKLSP